MTYLCYLVTVKPNNTIGSLAMEITNEILLQLISYHILVTCYRNFYKRWRDDSEEAIENKKTIFFDFKVGRSMILFIIALQVINIAVILGITCSDLILKFRRYRLK